MNDVFEGSYFIVVESLCLVEGRCKATTFRKTAVIVSGFNFIHGAKPLNIPVISVLLYQNFRDVKKMDPIDKRKLDY
jgi:hypothetical protein